MPTSQQSCHLPPDPPCPAPSHITTPAPTESGHSHETPNPPVSGGPREAGRRVPNPSPASGPRTAEGKAVSARNATTHGLFCRQTVLPHLGEDADGYKKLLDALFQQFDPRTLMERQYLELWAEASWKLRRLSRWEAQLWEQDDLDEDGRLSKLERVMRLQTTLRRQLDKAVRMLSRDVPDIQNHYARRAVLAARALTETDCREDPATAYKVEFDTQAEILNAGGLDESAQAKLDTPKTPEADSTPCPPVPDPTHKNCQNEPPDLSPSGPMPPRAQRLPPSLPGEKCPVWAEKGLLGNGPLEYSRKLSDNDRCLIERTKES